jgi:hypothetical protein
MVINAWYALHHARLVHPPTSPTVLHVTALSTSTPAHASPVVQPYSSLTQQAACHVSPHVLPARRQPSAYHVQILPMFLKLVSVWLNARHRLLMLARVAFRVQHSARHVRMWLHNVLFALWAITSLLGPRHVPILVACWLCQKRFLTRLMINVLVLAPMGILWQQQTNVPNVQYNVAFAPL